MTSSVEDWLRSLGLIQYTQAFLDNGYDELDICKEIGEEDLDAIGVGNIRDRVDILTAVERLKQSGTAVYFVLEGDDTGTQCQTLQPREKFIPLKLKMLIHDKLDEDKVKLTDPPYTKPDGSCGNLTALITLYADKFYTYEEDVLVALESMRQRMVGEMVKTEDDNEKQASTLPRTSSKTKGGSPAGSTRGRQRESSSSSMASDTSKSSECHSAPPYIDGKIKTPADYLDVSSPPPEQKVKRRRPVERNSKLSRSLDSLKELHVNVKENEGKPRIREQSSFRNKFSWFRSSKRSSKAVSQDDKFLEKTPPPAVGGDLPASDITMGEEDRMTLMIMVKQGDLTVEEAVEQLTAYEKEQHQGEKRIEQKSGSCSEEDSPSAKPKMKRGLFGKSTKKRQTFRPVSEIVACDMKMSEQDRIDLMKSVRDHNITVEQAMQRLMSYEEKHKDDEESPTHKSKSVKHKFSPKSGRSSSSSRISIKRVSGAFASVMGGGPQKTTEKTSVFYTGKDTVPLAASSEEDTASSPDPSPGGNRRLADVQNADEFPSSSSLHSSSSSVGKITEEPEPRFSASAPANQLHGLLNEIQTVLSVREDNDSMKAKGLQSSDASPENVSTMPRREKPAHLQANRKSSLPNPTPKQPLLPPATPRRPPPVPPRKATPPTQRKAPPKPPTKPKATDEKSNESGQESGTESEPPLPRPRKNNGNTEGRALSPEGGSEDDDRLPSPPPPHMLLQDDLTVSGAKVEGVGVENRSDPPKWQPPSHVASDIPVVPPRRKSKDCVTDNVTQSSVTQPPPLPPRPEGDSSDVNTCSGGRPAHVYSNTRPSVVIKNTVTASDNSETAVQDTSIPVAKDTSVPVDKDIPVAKDVPVAKGVPVAKDTSVPVAKDSSGSVAKESRIPVTKGFVKPKPPVKSKPKPPPKPPKPGPPTAIKPTPGEARPSKLPVPEPSGKANVTPPDVLRVPIPKKRASHSLSELVERRLRIEQINLSEPPYTDASGRWGVPVNLVERYSEELRRSSEEIAQIMDRIRNLKLKEHGRKMISCDLKTQLSGADPVGDLTSISDWLTSLGLPMYIDNMIEVEYDDMSHLPYLKQKHFEYAGVVDQRHMRRLLTSVEGMPR